MKVGRPDYSGRGTGLGDLADAFEISSVRHLRATVGLGDENRVQTEVVDSLYVIVREFAAAIVIRGALLDLVACQLTHAVDQHLFFAAQFKRCVETIKYAHRKTL